MKENPSGSSAFGLVMSVLLVLIDVGHDEEVIVAVVAFLDGSLARGRMMASLRTWCGGLILSWSLSCPIGLIDYAPLPSSMPHRSK